jgi:hypothetical protein
MRRDRLPIDEIDNADRMLGITIIGLAAACGLYVLIKFVTWVLA